MKRDAYKITILTAKHYKCYAEDLTCCVHINIYSFFHSGYSEAIASQLLENNVDMLPRY